MHAIRLARASRVLSGVRAHVHSSRGTHTSPPSFQPASTDGPSTPKPKRVNPYRLPPLPVFLASFAPLHAAGWRLDAIGESSTGGSTSHSAADDVLGGADLQHRRLTRAYAFPANREGWRAVTALLARVGEAVEAEDHHPTLTVAPYSDLSPAMAAVVALPDEAGYVLHVSTHTHTPLAPLGTEFEGTPKPGVTYKDLRLAERLEALVE